MAPDLLRANGGDSPSPDPHDSLVDPLIPSLPVFPASLPSVYVARGIHHTETRALISPPLSFTPNNHSDFLSNGWHCCAPTVIVVMIVAMTATVTDTLTMTDSAVTDTATEYNDCH